MEGKSVLLGSMPFADPLVPSIQLSTLESYLKEKGVTVSSIHLYLYAAQFYGLDFYTHLINPPNDPYASQMVYAKYVFPDHWKENLNHFKKYYNTSIIRNEQQKTVFPFELYCEKTDMFLQWLTKSIPWNRYDIIGFSLNYGQFLPSLAIAKHIKKMFPTKHIVFGGSTTIGDLGRRILDAFDVIDSIITGDGEESLYLLATLSEDNYDSIPGLIKRTNGNAILIQEPSYININTSPFPDFSSYYQTLQTISSEIQQYIQLNSRLPIEISRGCWWNRCSFCNQCAFHPFYREKNINRFVDELENLSDTYKMLSFQIIGSTLPKENLQDLCMKIISLNKDFSLIAESRADRLNDYDYYLLKQAGFHTIQTGIETFSRNFIKKMNKGARVIDNIAALKFCKEHGIRNEYNFIINFPNEESIDYQETIEITQLISSYLDPPRISPFVVGFNSLIYQQLEKYNIQYLKKKRTDKIMFPDYILDKNIHFFYDYKPINETPNNDWQKLISQWEKKRSNFEEYAIKTKKQIDRLVFYYIDGGNFIKIYDKRNINNINIFILNEKERMVFLACHNIKTYDQLKNRFNYIFESELQTILNDLVEQKIIYQEDNRFLSLPLQIHQRKFTEEKHRNVYHMIETNVEV